VKVPSTDNMKGLSRFLGGTTISLSMASNNLRTYSLPTSGSVSLQAAKALPLIIIALSPSYSY